MPIPMKRIINPIGDKWLRVCKKCNKVFESDDSKILKLCPECTLEYYKAERNNKVPIF